MVREGTRRRGSLLTLAALGSGAATGVPSAAGHAAARSVLTIGSGDATTTLDPGKAASDASEADYEELAL